MTALAIQHKQAFIEGMRQGKNLDDIVSALNLDITRQAVSKVLKDDPEYQDAKEEWHSARINKAEGMVESAVEQVDVARARAYWQAVTWRAEREMPDKWGQKQQHIVFDARDFADQLRRAQERVITQDVALLTANLSASSDAPDV